MRALVKAAKVCPAYVTFHGDALFCQRPAGHAGLHAAQTSGKLQPYHWRCERREESK